MKDEAAELSIRARRKAEELLAGMIEHGGDRRSTSRLRAPTLNEVGVTKTESSAWQALARFPDAEFEATLKAIRSEKPGTLSVQVVVRAARAWARALDEEHAHDDARARAAREVKASVNQIRVAAALGWDELDDEMFKCLASKLERSIAELSETLDCERQRRAARA